VLLDLIYEYRVTLRDTKKQKAKLEAIPEDERTNHDNEDIKQYSNMISHLQFTIEWLNTGRLPGAKRGYDRKEVYKRMIPVHNDTLDIVKVETTCSNQSGEVSEVDRDRIDDALSTLTDKEKDVYLLHIVGCYSFEEIASLMGVKKGTTQKHYERAKNKIEERTLGSLFCLAE